jgi:hypothetical protein
VITFSDGQRYVELASDDPAIKELVTAGAKPVGVIQVIEGTNEREVTFFTADNVPDLLHSGNGGGVERRKYWFTAEEWERIAQRQRRLGT